MDIKDLYKKHNITPEFPKAVKSELKGFSGEITEDELNGRTLLFDKQIITIDGSDAKDLDDAISIEYTADGNYLLGVHIADVSHYVRENTALDDEALRRGTSIYLVDTVVPMLPELLSNNLCSLNPDEVKLTLSCFMEFTPTGKRINYSIEKSAIKSSFRMTYESVRKILDGDMAERAKYKELLPMLSLMHSLALILRDKRAERGSVDFNFPEPYIKTAPDGTVEDVTCREISVANRIIEEFMLAANETVAQHLQRADVPAVYRVHEAPDGEKTSTLANFVSSLGYKFRATKKPTPKSFQKLVFASQGTPEEEIISGAALRAMTKAIYSPENLGHFGLASEYYCHFTSPIRRYPDLLVHRILKKVLDGETNFENYRVITADAADKSTAAEIAAVEAEREWTAYNMCLYMEDKLGQDFDGIISSVTSFGMFVRLPNTIEGLVKMSDLNNDYYEFYEDSYCLVGRFDKQVYKIGDKIKVRLARVNAELCQIDFVPIDMVEGKSLEKEVKRKNGSKHKKRGKKRKGRRSK